MRRGQLDYAATCVQDIDQLLERVRQTSEDHRKGGARTLGKNCRAKKTGVVFECLKQKLLSLRGFATALLDAGRDELSIDVVVRHDDGDGRAGTGTEHFGGGASGFVVGLLELDLFRLGQVWEQGESQEESSDEEVVATDGAEQAVDACSSDADDLPPRGWEPFPKHPMPPPKRQIVDEPDTDADDTTTASTVEVPATSAPVVPMMAPSIAVQPIAPSIVTLSSQFLHPVEPSPDSSPARTMPASSDDSDARTAHGAQKDSRRPFCVVS